MNGVVQGNFCWYCAKAAELKCPEESLSSVKERVDLNTNDDKKTFFNWRRKVVESVLETGTWSTRNVKGSVMVEESSALHSSHRGSFSECPQVQEGDGANTGARQRGHKKK